MFDVAQGQWVTLDKSFIPAVAGAVDMAAKHRPMEVVTLPIGRLAAPEGGSHE